MNGQHARGYEVTVWANIFDDEVEDSGRWES